MPLLEELPKVVSKNVEEVKENLDINEKKVMSDKFDKLYEHHDPYVINSHFSAVKDGFRLYAQTCLLVNKPDIAALSTHIYPADSLEDSILTQMWQLA